MPTDQGFKALHRAAGLRERKKVETREALVDAAVRLFTEQGYERTTVDEIAAAVGVSARTFHRYFPRKEDVVLADSTERVARFRRSLAAHADAASPLASVRAAVAEAVLGHHTADEGHRAWQQLHAREQVLSATPALRAYNVAIQDEWVSAVASHAARMVGERSTDRWPSLFAACTISAIAAAIQRWWRDSTIVLGDEYNAMLDLLEPIDRLALRS